MLMVVPRREAIRTLQGWATAVLLEAAAICECEEHGWMIDRADPQARDRALFSARQDPPFGFAPDDSVAAIHDIFASIGNTCPECPPG
jgi:hypothetical protein